MSSTPPSLPLDATSFTAMVDHTLLKATATREAIVRLCAEAVELGTAAVCVNSLWVRTVRDELDATEVATCSVVGFPLGSMSEVALAAETGGAVDDGAVEIDMVIPVGPLVAGDDTAVGSKIATVRRAAPDALVKVILETALLTDDQIRLACTIAVAEGADFVKTSTGFDPAGGATPHAVSLMRAAVGPSIGVKASGGIRTLADVEAMVLAGADRLGMSATAAVVAELERRRDPAG